MHVGQLTLQLSLTGSICIGGEEMDKVRHFTSSAPLLIYARLLATNTEWSS
jgi:hypothetical protein